MVFTQKIISGMMDSELDAISKAIDTRKKLLRETKIALTMSDLKIGDKVKLRDLRPKYINGIVAEVVKLNRTTVAVRMPERSGRFSGIVNCPASCLDKV